MPTGLRGLDTARSATPRTTRGINTVRFTVPRKCDTGFNILNVVVNGIASAKFHVTIN